MQTLSNNSGLSMAMAVWLAHDDYSNGQEQFPGKSIISATSLLKPIRQLVLTNRVPPQDSTVDVADRIALRLGHAIHESIESVWHGDYATTMMSLGYPKKIIDNIRINPESVEDGDIPVYLERRAFRSITVDGHEIIISGQLDQVFNGELNDTKTTSVYAYINRSKEEDYALQGSIYRWLNPGMITSDIMRIQHVFTDWQRSQARINPDYPQNRVIEFKVEMLPLAETEAFIKNRIREILANQGLPENEIVRCTDKELWKTDPAYKYYADPVKAAAGGRSTKNFPNYPAAATYCSNQGKGVVVTVPGQVKACGYCSGSSICTQKLEYEINP